MERRLGQSRAEFQRSAIDLLDVGRASPLGRDQRGAERDHELELLLAHERAVLEYFEQRLRATEMADRLGAGRALTGALARGAPVTDRFLGQRSLGAVMGKELQRALGRLAVAGLRAPR